MAAPTIDQAIDALRKLSPQRQQELAGYIYSLAADDRVAEDVDPADLPAVLEGLEQAKRRQFASPERIAAALGFKAK
jgi:DNA-binding TFAR19-related protein (PDSD5 family)